MATGTNFSVTLRGLRQFRDKLGGIARGMGNRAELHRRFGIEGMKWVDGNFGAQGGLLSTGPWAKLRPGTVLGRRKGSAVVLQDTGQLRQSFTMSFDSAQAVVGSPKKYAPYHEKGGTGSYPISPKNKTFLAFPSPAGTPLRRATFFPSKQRTFPRGTPFVFTKNTIQHPPLPQRRMLPRTNEIMPTLLKVAIAFVDRLRGKGEAL